MPPTLPPKSAGDDDGVGNALGRTFIIDDQGTRGRLQWVTTQPGREEINVNIPFGGPSATLPGREQQRVLAFVNPDTGEPLFQFTGGWYNLAGTDKWLDIDAQGSVFSPGGTQTIAGSGGGTAAGLTFEQRRQLEGEARTFAAEEAEKQRQFTTKRDLTAETGRLTRELVGLREQARNLVTEQLGTDVLRGSLGAQGALTIGTTPARAQENVLRGVAGQPIPGALGAEATIPQLEGRVGELTQATQGGLPRPGTPLGFAHGGTIEMAKGGDGVFSATEGTTGRGLLVGEAGPQGEARPEVIEFTPQGTIRVIPLMGSAQGGLEEFNPFENIAPSPTLARDPDTGAFANTQESILRAFEPAFGALGFGGRVPQAGTGPFGQSLGGSAETFARLGVRPTLLQAAETNEFFFRTPEGEIQKIGGFAELGALGLGGTATEQITVLPFSEIQEMGEFRGGRLTELPPATLQPFAQEPSPLRIPLSVDAQGLPDRSGPSIFIPAPRQFAGVWRTFDTETKSLLSSAWTLAGKSVAEQARELDFFTPRGTASQFATAALR